MNVSVVIPIGGDCPHRAAALRWVTDRYLTEHPDWSIVHADGTTPDGYSRSRAIVAGAQRAAGDVLLVADGDVWCDSRNAVDAARESGWAVPHRLIHRLSPESTEQVLAGVEWRGLPLSTDNRRDHTPYVGNEAGTLIAIRRDVLLDVPPDVRFVGWGQEDTAWSTALRRLVGKPWRGAEDLVHLWHPPQPRRDRSVGSDANLALARRYAKARRPEAMRELIEESKRADPTVLHDGDHPAASN